MNADRCENMAQTIVKGKKGLQWFCTQLAKEDRKYSSKPGDIVCSPELQAQCLARTVSAPFNHKPTSKTTTK